MADFEVDNEVQESKPKKSKKAKGGGNLGMIILGAVAVAAIVMSVVLFMQVSALRQQVYDAGQPWNDAEGGGQQAATNGESHGEETGDGHGVDPMMARAGDPIERTYPLGKFTANTSDGKVAVMDITLALRSYYNEEDLAMYNREMGIYEKKYEEYNTKMQKWLKKEGYVSHPVYDSPYTLVPAALLAGAPAETGPPEEPHHPEEPQTIVETMLDSNSSQIKDLIIKHINTHSAASLVTIEGREEFKETIKSTINNQIIEQSDLGTVTDVFFNELITT
jgi:flagellar basal body-associated protein FliL